MAIKNISQIKIAYDVHEENEWVSSENHKLMDEIDDFLKKYEIIDLDYFLGCPAAEPYVSIEIDHNPELAEEIEQGIKSIIYSNGYGIYQL